MNVHDQPTLKPPSRTASASQALGWVVAVVGLVILAGWIRGNIAWQSLTPGMVTVKANTAICFVLAGVAVAGLAGKRARLVRLAQACAGVVALIGFLTLVEYATGRNLGIDQLLFLDRVSSFDTVHPGRMAVPTATSFLILGIGLLLLRTRAAPETGWLALAASVFSGLAFIGYLYDLPLLATFGPFTPIAPPTAITLLLLSLALLLATNSRLLAALRQHGRNLSFAAALLLLVVLGGAVLRNTNLLVENSGWVAHTHVVLEKLAGLRAILQDLETAQRSYLLTGDRRLLEPTLAAPGQARGQLDTLRDLVSDNPAQQQNLAELAPLVERNLADAEVVVHGPPAGGAGVELEDFASGRRHELMGAIRLQLGKMERAERELLRERQARVESGTRKTMLTLRSGLLVCLALLITVFLRLRGEIAHRARVAAALRRSEESLAVTLNSIGDAVLATDTAGRITRMNRVAEQLTGWTRDSARTRPVAEVFRILNEVTRQPAVIPVDEVLATGQIHGLANHTVLLARDGTEHPIADSAAPIRDADGKIQGVVLVFRDTTAERAAERALRESELRYRTLFESIDEGFCIIGLIFDDAGRAVDYRFLETNAAFVRHTGLNGAVGRRMREIAPAHEEHWFETYGRVALTGEPIRFQNRAEQLGRTYDVYAFRFGDAAQRQVAILFSDITLREQTRAELDRFFTLSLDFLCIAGADGFFKRVSPAITDMLGWTTEEFLARPFLEFVHPDDQVATQREVERQIISGQKVLFFENRYRHKDGSWRTLAWRSVPHGQLMYATARDVTELRRHEAEVARLNTELQQRAAQLETSNRELEAFSYSVSHDLRAPLRHVQGFVELLAREANGQLSAKAQRYMKTIAEAGADMGRLIDDLLSFSKMGRAELRAERVDLSLVVAEISRQLTAAAPGRNITWHLEPLPAVLADSAMLRQVLVNLLDNAVKYTRQRDAAEIWVGCSGQDDGRLVFFVRDNGAGFDMAYADKLFGVFQRLHRSDEFEGTGIGLANVRRIISRHHGRTWAEARVNVGATIFFTLPAAPPA